MSADQGTRFVIGGAMVAGAVVLAWLSSPATMVLERTADDPVPVERTDGATDRTADGVADGGADGQTGRQADRPSATILMASRLFGVIEFGRQRVEGVTGARMVDSRVPGQDSETPPHLVFETSVGDVNLGRPQQLFARDIVGIRSFFEGQTEPRQTLSSIARSEETRRFVFAQIAVAFLGFIGIAVLWATVRSLWS